MCDQLQAVGDPLWGLCRDKHDVAPAPYWSGRRVLASIDAASWTAFALFAAMSLPKGGRLTGAVITACCALIGVRAGFKHRYRFRLAMDARRDADSRVRTLPSLFAFACP